MDVYKGHYNKRYLKIGNKRLQKNTSNDIMN